MRETENRIYDLDAEISVIEANAKKIFDKDTAVAQKKDLIDWFHKKLKEYRMRSESKEFFGGGAPRSFTPEEYGELCDRIVDVLVDIKNNND